MNFSSSMHHALNFTRLGMMARGEDTADPNSPLPANWYGFPAYCFSKSPRGCDLSGSGALLAATVELPALSYPALQSGVLVAKRGCIPVILFSKFKFPAKSHFALQTDHPYFKSPTHWTSSWRWDFSLAVHPIHLAIQYRSARPRITFLVWSS